MSRNALSHLFCFRAPNGRNKRGCGRRTANRGRGNDGSVRFRLPTGQLEALPDALIRAFLTQKVPPGEQEPNVLLHRHCVEIETFVRPDSVALYIDDFQRTQIELGELMIRVGYYHVV